MATFKQATELITIPGPGASSVRRVGVMHFTSGKTAKRVADYLGHHSGSGTYDIAFAASRKSGFWVVSGEKGSRIALLSNGRTGWLSNYVQQKDCNRVKWELI